MTFPAPRRNRFETAYGGATKSQLSTYQQDNTSVCSPTIFSSIHFLEKRSSLLSSTTSHHEGYGILRGFSYQSDIRPIGKCYFDLACLETLRTDGLPMNGTGQPRNDYPQTYPSSLLLFCSSDARHASSTDLIAFAGVLCPQHGDVHNWP